MAILNYPSMYINVAQGWGTIFFKIRKYVNLFFCVNMQSCLNILWEHLNKFEMITLNLKYSKTLYLSIVTSVFDGYFCF